ncbi:MAG: cytosolic protein [Dehalococcoidia bacterium]|nr:cytosolic protein [Dehalococcoidia bacterium]
MADQATVSGLLQGAFDTHIHSSPDVLPRRFEDIGLVQRATAAGMAGFVLKSHYNCTVDRATLLRRMFPGVKVYGGIVLNNSVGGLNPIAVDVAGRLGNKVVWLPTVDSHNEFQNVSGQLDESKLPYWMTIAREMRAKGIAGQWIKCTDDDNRVTALTRQCLEIIAQYDMVLATGHISPAEMLPVVRAAKEAGVSRIIITHPEFPTTMLPLSLQQDLVKHDVLFERCFTTPYTNKVSWEQVVANIRGVGPSTTILATDLGQTFNPHVDEGLSIYVGKMLDAGFSEREVEGMVSRNPAQVLGDIKEAPGTVE